MKSFKDLEVWKRSMDLVTQVYQLTLNFPGNEQYGLTSQMRRAAVSIPSNIAEGQGRHNPKEFAQFLYIAKGSLAELDTQLQICQRLNLIGDADTLFEQIKVIRVMLINLIKKLQA
jgi:four helix bundle protein